MTSSWRDRPLSQAWPALAAVASAVFVAPVVLISACSADAATQPGPIVPSPAGEWLRDQFEVADVRVGERTITCIYGSTEGGGVLSCDWGAK